MRAYLDHASTTPLRPEARRAMVSWLERTDVGDPSRLHTEGMTARVAVEEARERVAAALGARPREVIFTSGATESIAMACFGAAEARGRHSVLAPIEHSAVRDWAERGDVSLVPVSRRGRIDPEAVGAAVSSSIDAGRSVGVVHCQWGNHEVGTLQPVADVIAAVDGRSLVHVDGAAAAGHVPVAFADSGIDLLSVSGHKFGGPAGVGALLVRRGLRVPPLLVGGDQERARRAGMENVAGIAGFAAGLEAATASLDAEGAAARRLTDRVIAWAIEAVEIEVLGDPVDRLPHLVCLGLAGVEPQPVLLGLDAAGVSVHSGSSCSSESIEPSPVLAAMGVDAERSLRISVGWSSTDDDIDRLLDALPRVLGDLRSLRRG
jgi:cysteine desulfurase